MNQVIDELTYRSWWYQIHWYGMSREAAQNLFKDWELYERKEKGESK